VNAPRKISSYSIEWIPSSVKALVVQEMFRREAESFTSDLFELFN